MQLSPTFPTRVLTGVALLGLTGSVCALNPIAFAWTAALVIGLAAARVLTQVSVVKARCAGFEMLWQHPQRHARTIRDCEFTLSAELRNRSGELLILESISALTPPALEARINPCSALLPAGSALPVELRIRPRRVGTHGIQGLSVVVRSDVSSFEVQLTFANPFVLDVRPCATGYFEVLRSGGLGRMSAPAPRTGRVSGDSTELRELRTHQPGDALRKVAWKASARRGRLMVRDDEREHRHLLWYVLDASVELWAGNPAEAAMDLAIDQVSSLIRQSMRRGDRVGLSIVAARQLVRILPNEGANHEQNLLDALSNATGTLDADRSGLDEHEVATLVLEHLRPIDPNGTRLLLTRDWDGIARLAHRTLDRVHLPERPEPFGVSPRDRLLRRYLSVFGLPSPPRTSPDRHNTDGQLIESITWLATQRPDRIRVVSPWPSPKLVEALTKAQRRLKKQRIVLDWIAMNVHYGAANSPVVSQQLLHDSLKWREQTEAGNGRLALRKIGILAATPLRIKRTPDTTSSQ
ncbi:MAG TPA: DUF58 domain-containing protein [Polyangiaceae bacterium]